MQMKEMSNRFEQQPTKDTLHLQRKISHVKSVCFNVPTIRRVGGHYFFYNCSSCCRQWELCNVYNRRGKDPEREEILQHCDISGAIEMERQDRLPLVTVQVCVLHSV